MTEGRLDRHLLALLALAPVLTGCAADTVGQEFRERLPQLVGQPVQILLDDLGSDRSSATGAGPRLRWDYLTVAHPSRECRIDVDSDLQGRITGAAMHGSDYECGLMLLDLRRRQARYRANPGLREREARELEALTNQVIEIRRRLNERDPH